MKYTMAETNDVQKSQEQTMLITKESLRPPCKRKRTRSTTTTLPGKVDGLKGREEMKEKVDILKGDIGCDRKCMKYVAAEKTEASRHCSERILRRVCKQPCTRSATPCSVPLVKVDTLLKEQQIETPQDKDSDSTVQTKNRRQWEQWSDNDVECFFKGLAEHGKDFASIQLHMKKKQRSKHDDDTKTKEQIRYFYHRTWAKLAKSLNLAQETNQKKAYRRELHYMLCLGELRKRGTIGLGQKVLKQLNELVTKGLTYIRYNCKNIRVRPPNRYLKKLYRDENSVHDVLLPKHVNIEFLPNSNSAFNYVQMHAFNPRIRFVNVNINSKFSEVFDLFDKRFTDLCQDGQELMLYPVFSGDVDSVHFAEVISNAEDTLESCEKKQETPIILEESSLSPGEQEQLDLSNESIDTAFPKVFGQGGTSLKETKTNFLGYWTRSIADEIHLRTLFLALGKIIPMKFRYEWKETEEKPSLATDSLKYLRGYCIHEKTIKEAEDINGKIRTIVPKKKEIENVPVTYCSSVDSLCLPVNKHFPLPLRPRPGRQRGKRNILNSQMCVPKNRARNLSTSSQRLNNAVAVNIIPQPPGLEQFTTQLPHNNCAKVPLSDTNFYSQPVNGILSVEHPSLGSVIHEEVIDEGVVNAHFKSLASILASSALNQNMTTTDIKEYLMLKTPIKKASNCETEPPSPNLEWLNSESLDVTLSSFLNVNEMQALQERLKNEKPSVVNLNGESSGSFQALLNEIPSIEGLKANLGNQINDPKLPVFHSGDTSQEPFGMSFDLSSQGDLKTKEDYG